jgi:tetratricopeptide (TPR) repeat protein
MKARYVLCFVSVLLVLTQASPSPASSSPEVDKAKEFMSAGMYPQAIELLNKRIMDKPTDADAHFLVGTCYVNTGNYAKADERFGSAVKLQPDFGYKIGAEYKKVGDTYLDKGNVQEAQSAYQKATSYQPQLKKEIAQRCFSEGEKYLNKSNTNSATGLLNTAVAYDNTLQEKKDVLFKIYASNILTYARSRPKEERKRYIDEARKYLSQELIDHAFPPPTWKSIPGYPKTFEGQGWKKENAFVIFTIGENAKIGDNVIITGEFASNFDSKNKPIIIKEEKFPIVGGSAGKGYWIIADKGRKVVVDIQRYETTY